MSEIPWTTEELHRAATLYYVQDETMQAIATRFGVSRSTVSRQLKEAQDRGIVRITVLDQQRRVMWRENSASVSACG